MSPCYCEMARWHLFFRRKFMKKELKMPKTKFEAIVFYMLILFQVKLLSILLLMLCSQQIEELLLF